MRENKNFYFLVLTFVMVLFTSCMSTRQKDVSVLVVRGEHAYDTPEFEEMCLSLVGIQIDLVLTSHMERMKADEINWK